MIAAAIDAALLLVQFPQLADDRAILSFLRKIGHPNP
jgi:hypothetical protein